VTGPSRSPAPRAEGRGVPLPPGARLRFTDEQIRNRVERMARRIGKDHPRGVVLVGVLNGGAFLLADLARRIRVPVRVDFLRLRSYGDARSPAAAAEITKDIEIDVEGLDVVVVEDIVDTGRSVSYIRSHFAGKRAGSLAFCALVDKRERREVDVAVDYRGFRLDKGFVVGYGMDCGGAYRHLPHIYVLPDPEKQNHSSEGSE
jgi:hypoxanthine phosphoribosyltransferase